jgi:hypothetical protein
VVSGADWLSVLKTEGTMRLSLLVSLLRTFSTRWKVFGTDRRGFSFSSARLQKNYGGNLSLLSFSWLYSCESGIDT